MKQIRSNSWLAALFSWVVATALVTLVYVIYVAVRGGSVDWVIVRNASGIALLLAVVNGFRDRNRKTDD